MCCERLRIDQVGSLLRPQRLKAAFEAHERAKCSTDVLRRVQDECIAELVAAQVEHGLPVVTDGEFRRFVYQDSFAEVAGFDLARRSLMRQIRARPTDPRLIQPEDPVLRTRQAATQRLRLIENAPLREFIFVRGLTITPAKVTLIGPDRISQMYDIEASRSIYASMDEFLKDVIAVERQIIAELVEAGCPYVQIDEPGYTAYVDPLWRDALRASGQDVVAVLRRSIAADNALVDGFPQITFGIHICRGNGQSMWHRQGTYDDIAEQLLTGLNFQRFLLEYDTDRAGTFEPLRFMPAGRVAVLGLITTKSDVVETVDFLRRRLDDAARFLDFDQMALSPQCGFASSLPGNLLSEEAQWRKLDVMLETARVEWGDLSGAPVPALVPGPRGD